MKYTDLTAVENIDREEMSKTTGGTTLGDILPNLVPGLGGGNWAKDIFGTTLGKVIQAASNSTGVPGENAGKSIAGVDLPPGLE